MNEETSRLKGKKILFVINPIAGGIEKADVPEHIKEFCDLTSCRSESYETTGKDDKKHIKEIVESYNPEAVIAIGGDGTVNMVGEVLADFDMPLGIIPLGSSNGLAKDLGIPEGVEEAFDLLAKFNIVPIDTMRINGYNCFHLSDLGFNARIVHRFDKSLLRGKISYFWYGIQEFFYSKSFRYKVEADNEEYTGKAFMIIIANTNKFGNNVNINPLGKINDGCFEIGIIKPFSIFSAPLIGYHLFSDTIYRTRFYKVIRCSHAVLHNPDHELLHIDGEPVSLQEKLNIDVLPSGLKLFLPEKD